MNYNERHAAIVQYMQAKIAEKDWHGVSDAANDLREMEAEQRGLDDEFYPLSEECAERKLELALNGFRG